MILRSNTVRRFDEFEAVRGMAAVAVVVFHAYQQAREPYSDSHPGWHVVLHNLDTLVDLFFVLSAFLLTTPWIQASVNQRQPQSARGYLVRRAIRILPVYWVAILVVWAARTAQFPGDWRDLLEHLTFTQVFDTKRIFFTIGPAWSLAVEGMFYLFLLVVGLLLHRLCSSLRHHGLRLAAWSVVPVLMATVGCWWIWWSQYVRLVPPTHYSTWFGPMAKLPVFAVGVAAAVLVAALPAGVALRGPLPMLLRLVGFAVVGWAWVWREQAGGVLHEQWVHPVAAIGFAMVLAASALAPGGGLSERFLGARPLLILGTISYSVYIWHEPVLRLLATHNVVFTESNGPFLAGAAVLLPLALLAGWLSYWIVEYPVMQVKTALDRTGRLIDPYVDQPSSSLLHEKA